MPYFKATTAIKSFKVKQFILCPEANIFVIINIFSSYIEQNLPDDFERLIS